MLGVILRGERIRFDWSGRASVCWLAEQGIDTTDMPPLRPVFTPLDGQHDEIEIADLRKAAGAESLSGEPETPKRMSVIDMLTRSAPSLVGDGDVFVDDDDDDDGETGAHASIFGASEIDHADDEEDEDDEPDSDEEAIESEDESAEHDEKA